MTSLFTLHRPRHSRPSRRFRRALVIAVTTLGPAFAPVGTQSGPALAAAGPPPAPARAAAAQPAAMIRPNTGKGCHTYDWWNGFDICIEVWGGGLSVQRVEGWVDGRDGAADVGHLYTTDGDLNTEEHLDGNGQAWFDWTVGGGIWLTNYQNICFKDETTDQAACIYLNVS